VLQGQSRRHSRACGTAGSPWQSAGSPPADHGCVVGGSKAIGAPPRSGRSYLTTNRPTAGASGDWRHRDSHQHQRAQAHCPWRSGNCAPQDVGHSVSKLAPRSAIGNARLAWLACASPRSPSFLGQAASTAVFEATEMLKSIGIEGPRPGGRRALGKPKAQRVAGACRRLVARATLGIPAPAAGTLSKGLRRRRRHGCGPRRCKAPTPSTRNQVRCSRR